MYRKRYNILIYKSVYHLHLSLRHLENLFHPNPIRLLITYICMYLYMYLYLCVYIYVYIFIYVSISIRTNIYIHISIYIYIYKYIYTSMNICIYRSSPRRLLYGLNAIGICLSTWLLTFF
jgi:hypothetical protein